jgi:hypothetical protein
MLGSHHNIDGSLQLGYFTIGLDFDLPAQISFCYSFGNFCDRLKGRNKASANIRADEAWVATHSDLRCQVFS